MSDLCSRMELMSRFNATPAESSYLCRLESWLCCRSSDDKNRHDLRPSVCLFLSSSAFFLHSFVLSLSGETVLQTSDAENSRYSWCVRSECEEWSVIQLYQQRLTSKSLICFLQMSRLPWGLYLSYRSKILMYLSPERLQWPPWES